MTEQEGQSVDQRLLGLSPEQAAALAQQLYGEGRGPLDGPYVPTGSGTVRTASGRDPAVAETEGPLPAAPGTADEAVASRPAQPPSGPSGGPPATRWSPATLEMVRALLAQVQPSIQEHGPPPGYRPPQDELRVTLETPDEPRYVDPVTSVRRLFTMAPPVVRAALPNSRERSIVLRALDDARLWFEEACRLEADRIVENLPQPPPKG